MTVGQSSASHGIWVFFILLGQFVGDVLNFHPYGRHSLSRANQEKYSCPRVGLGENLLDISNVAVFENGVYPPNLPAIQTGGKR